MVIRFYKSFCNYYSCLNDKFLNGFSFAVITQIRVPTICGILIVSRCIVLYAAHICKCISLYWHLRFLNQLNVTNAYSIHIPITYMTHLCMNKTKTVFHYQIRTIRTLELIRTTIVRFHFVKLCDNVQIKVRNEIK